MNIDFTDFNIAHRKKEGQWKKKVVCMGSPDSLLPETVWERLQAYVEDANQRSCCVTLTYLGQAYDIILCEVKAYALSKDYPIYCSTLDHSGEAIIEGTVSVTVPSLIIVPLALLKVFSSNAVRLASLKNHGIVSLAVSGEVRVSGDGDCNIGIYQIRTGGVWTESCHQPISGLLGRHRYQIACRDHKARYGNVTFKRKRLLPTYLNEEVFIGDPGFAIPELLWDDVCRVLLSSRASTIHVNNEEVLPPMLVMPTFGGDGGAAIYQHGKLLFDADIETGTVAIISLMLLEKMTDTKALRDRKHGLIIPVSGQPMLSHNGDIDIGVMSIRTGGAFSRWQDGIPDKMTYYPDAEDRVIVKPTLSCKPFRSEEQALAFLKNFPGEAHDDDTYAFSIKKSALDSITFPHKIMQHPNFL